MPVFADTHTHLYLEQFNEDRNDVVEAALIAGVKWMLLPNVDNNTIDPMLQLCDQYPGICMPMMGLHPTSVKPGFEAMLRQMKGLFDTYRFCAIGETGIDLYWDKTFFDLQVTSFTTQIEWALEFDLPLVVHSRNSVEEIMDTLDPYRQSGLKGIMHCFPGTAEQAKWFVDFGFYLGIGGVVTYKNSLMAEVVKRLPLSSLLLETDAPYLPPVPYRGKRNQSSYIPFIAQKTANIKGVSVEEVAKITTENTINVFKITGGEI